MSSLSISHLSLPDISQLTDWKRVATYGLPVLTVPLVVAAAWRWKAHAIDREVQQKVETAKNEPDSLAKAISALLPYYRTPKYQELVRQLSSKIEQLGETQTTKLLRQVVKSDAGPALFQLCCDLLKSKTEGWKSKVPDPKGVAEVYEPQGLRSEPHTQPVTQAYLSGLTRTTSRLLQVVFTAYNITLDAPAPSDPSRASLELSSMLTMIREPVIVFAFMVAWLRPRTKRAWVAPVAVGSGCCVGLFLLYRLHVSLNQHEIGRSRYGTNLTSYLQEHGGPAVIGRDNEIDDLAASLNPNRSQGSVIMLVAPSGTGKTAIVDGLTRAISQGRYPRLEGYQVISYSTTELIEQGEKWHGLRQSRLQNIQEQYRLLTKDPAKVILFFDEAATLGKNQSASGPNPLEQLKVFLSTQRGLVICATTDEEYQKYIMPDQALAGRVVPVVVPELNRETCLQIARETLERDLGGLEVDPSALERLFDLTQGIQPKIAQPKKLLKWLMRLGDRALNYEVKPEAMSPVRALKGKKALSSDSPWDGSSSMRELRTLPKEDPWNQDHVNNLVETKRAEDGLQAEITAKRRELNDYAQLCRHRHELRQKFKNLAGSASDWTESERTAYRLIPRYVKALDEEIRAHRKQLKKDNIPYKLDLLRVEKLFGEEVRKLQEKQCLDMAEPYAIFHQVVQGLIREYHLKDGVVKDLFFKELAAINQEPTILPS